MTTTIATKANGCSTIEKLREAQILQVIAPHGTEYSNLRAFIHGEHLITTYAGDRTHDLGHVDDLRMDGWSIEPHPASVMWKECGVFSTHAVRSYFRRYNIVLTDCAVANIMRVFGLSEGLEMTGKHTEAKWIRLQLWRALTYVSSTETMEFDNGHGETVKNVPRNKVLIGGEDEYSFCFRVHRPVSPADWSEAFAKLNKDDVGFHQAVIDTKSYLNCHDCNDRIELDLTHRWGHDKIHYRFGWNGGIIQRFHIETGTDWKCHENDHPAWSIHS